MFERCTTGLVVMLSALVVYSSGFNLTSPGSSGYAAGSRTAMKLSGESFQRGDLQTQEDWYNMTNLRDSGKLDSTTERHWDAKNTGNVYNRTGSDGFRRGIRLYRIFKQRHRFNNWRNLVNVGGRKRASNGREVRETREKRSNNISEYKSKLPPGFSHYYVPSSSIANAVLLNMIHPNHTLFLHQLKNVTVCLAEEMVQMNMDSLSRCYKSLTVEDLLRLWLRYLMGFIVLCSLTLLAVVVTAVVLPCFACWRMSIQPVVHPDKLDSYSNSTWAVLAVLSGLAVLFALFGMITVGCSGLGIGYYLKSGRTTEIYTTYEHIQEIAFGRINSPHLPNNSDNNLPVC